MDTTTEPPFEFTNPGLWQTNSYVGGKWTTSSVGKRFEIINPGTGDAFATCPVNTVDDVEVAVEAAQLAWNTYRKVNPRTRAQLLLKWYHLIVENTEDLATLLTYETGKPLVESRDEIRYAQLFLWWFAGESERIHGSTSIPSALGRRLLTIKQPIGVVAALVPWNFPIAMVLRKAGAALAAGCTMIIKPSPETPLTALSLAYLASKAGFGDGVINILTTDMENTPAVSESLCKNPIVRKITFTGSTRVGRIIAHHCADGIKKLTLELGGNCPFIVFDDANLNQAIDSLMSLKWRNAGQACITANRVYVQRGIHDEFVARLVAKTKLLKVGLGTNADTTLGALTVAQSLSKADIHVKDAKTLGAEIVCGGSRLANLKGFFFQPTIITCANHSMLIASEETFSPICAVFIFDTEDEVVKAANDTSMGLASYFFTKNIDRTWRLLENLDAGMIGMNTGNQSAAESPFGGIKESGYGKESGPEVAVNEYLITKTATLTLEDHF